MLTQSSDGQQHTHLYSFFYFFNQDSLIGASCLYKAPEIKIVNIFEDISHLHILQLNLLTTSDLYKNQSYECLR